jgi:uncharacterized membrane protein YgaE (UPF0421/DUF939 family)|tara:strand:- start:198 stop:434 length:237 start_codon:yes stop_codon:yes gene_type:complete
MKKRKKNKINENKNIIFIGIGIALIVILYFIASPYQQCVRGYVNMKIDKERMKHYPKAQQRETKNYYKSRAQIMCQKR